MRVAGIIVVVIMGAIHVFEAPEYFEFAAYLGGLFVANAVGSLVAAIGMARNLFAAWSLAALIAAATFAAYIVSRTAGLPGLPAEERSEFFEPLGIASLVVEAAVVVLYAVRSRSGRVQVGASAT